MWSNIAPSPTIDTTNIPIGEKSIPKSFEISSTMFGKKEILMKNRPIKIQINEYRWSKYLRLKKKRINNISIIPIKNAISLEWSVIMILF